MHLQQHLKFSLTAPFPESCELFLKNFVNLGYRIYMSPFRFVFDEHSRMYKLEKSFIRQVITILRFFGIMVQLAVSIKSKRFTRNLTIPGPMKIFSTGVGAGSKLIGFTFLLLTSTPKCQQDFLQLINLISVKVRIQRITGFRAVYNDPSEIYRKIKNSRRMNFEFLFHYFFLIGIVPVYLIKEMFNHGYKRTFLMTWHSANGDSPPQPGQAPQGIQHFRDLTWWMRSICVYLIYHEIDSEIQSFATLAIIFFMCRTLQISSSHFVANYIESKKYCSISNYEVMHHFKKFRAAFMLSSKIYPVLFFILFNTLTMNICVGLIQVFQSDSYNWLVMISIVLAYTSFTMIAAASSTAKLKRIEIFLNSSFPSGRRSESNSILKLIMMYENGSSALGISVYDVWTVTYGYMASVVVTLLSNATIVLQSYEYYAMARPPPPPSAD